MKKQWLIVVNLISFKILIMKNTFLFLAIICCSIIACNSDSTQEQSQSLSTLSGEITNAKEGDFTLRMEPENLKTKVVDGKFTLEFENKESKIFSFKYNDEYGTVYLQPGKQVHLKLDTEKFDETLTFSKDLSAENNYLASKVRLNELMPPSKDYGKFTEEQFLEKWEYKKSEENKLLKTSIIENPTMDLDFVANATLDNQYGSASSRMMYPLIFKSVTKKEAELSENYYSFLKDLKVDNAYNLESKEFKNFLYFFVEHHSKDSNKDDASEIAKLTNSFDIVDGLFSAPEIREYVKFDNLKSQLKYGGLLDGIDPLIASFKATSKDEAKKTELDELYKQWDVIKKGVDAPDILAKTIDGEEQKLSAWKGKNVYIDVWATWCGPCKKEIPALEELQKEFAGNENLVFTSISIDANKEKWETMVKEKELKGVQLLVDNAWDSDMCKSYLISSIPRFIIVDSDGKILDANAPRPSSNEIKTVLNNLVNRKISMK